MPHISLLYKKRTELRDQIKLFWKEGRTFGAHENAVNDELNAIHSDIIRHESSTGALPMQRVRYSVCGWSQRHEYFRNKFKTCATVEEAKKELAILKTDTASWGIPTIIVQERFFRFNSPAMVDFDSTSIEDLGFADQQELIAKHMCGSKGYTWNDLIKPIDSRFTY